MTGTNDIDSGCRVFATWRRRANALVFWVNSDEIWVAQREKRKRSRREMVLTSSIQVTLDLYDEVPYLRASFRVLKAQSVIGSVGFRPYYQALCESHECRGQIMGIKISTQM